VVVTSLDGPEDSDPTELQDPTWSQIETAISRLDGATCTLVCLGIGPPPVPHMAIGGGEGNNYIVYATVDNEVFYTLVNPEAPQGKRMLKVGGQVGDYALKMCVGLAEALRAARTYAETGQTDASLTWEKN
jgi:hypothetical protein